MKKNRGPATPKIPNRFNKKQLAEINQMLLIFILIHGDRMASALGLTDNMWVRISRLPIAKLNTQSSRPLLAIDHEAFGAWLTQSERLGRYVNLLDRSIQLGSRYNMARYYTGISRRSFNERRALLKVKPPGRGRIQLLDLSEEQRVFKEWEKLANTNTDSFEIICIVAEKTKLPLDKIWSSFRNRPPADLRKKD